MNKKTLLGFLFGILAVGIIILTYWSISMSKNVKRSSVSSVHSFEQVKNNGSRQKIKLNTSSPKQSASQETKQNEQERRDFNKAVLEQDYYLEKVDKNGNLTYVKATNEELEALEKKNKPEQFNVYQVEHDGQMISVLATPERN